jgi:Tfp pilus assembly protein PilF
VQYQVGMVALRAGAVEEALGWLYAALREDPDHAPSHKALMEHYQKTGDFARAAEHRAKAGPPPQGGTAAGTK